MVLLKKEEKLELNLHERKGREVGTLESLVNNKMNYTLYGMNEWMEDDKLGLALTHQSW